MNKNLVVERESYISKSGKQCYSYFVKGNIRGKDIRIAVATPDKDDFGGYQVLDIVFGDAMQAELVVKPFEMKNETTGEIVTGNTYAVRSYGENGEIYECKIKPSKQSDKSLLNMLVK